MAEVGKKAACHFWAVVGLVAKSFLVRVCLRSWKDNESFRHGGGEV